MENKQQLKYTRTQSFSPEKDAKYYEFSDFLYPYENIKTFPLPNAEGIERYLPLLPVENINVKLNGKVGGTSVHQAEKFGKVVGFNNLWIKHEDENVTGCFKDRESAVVISAALEQGIESVYVISSGNAALSTAAFAQKAGINCTCFVPEKTTPQKKDLIELRYAKLVEIPGFYEDVYRTAIDMHPKGWNVTTGQNEYRTEANKTIAFELWEQLGKVPDVVVVPCGNGGCLAGIWKGFVELKKLGKTDSLPQMVAVQVAGAAPLKTALEKGKDFTILGDIEDSVAEGIVAQESYCSPKAIKALKESGGYVVEVTDKEIKEALVLISKTESMLTEPTSAAVYAAAFKLQADPNSCVVLINTGSGLKMTEELIAIKKEVEAYGAQGI